MFTVRINKRMFRMKLHYFLYMGGISCVQGFWPTIAKQLGYSPMFVGSLYTYLSILALLAKPICGIIVDKYPVKRILFLTVVLSCGFSASSLYFIQKLPTETAVNLSCSGRSTVLNVCSNTNSKLSDCDTSLSKLLRNSTEIVKCQLSCQHDGSFWDEMCKSSSNVDYCSTLNTTFKSNGTDYLSISILANTKHQGRQNVNFKVQSVENWKKQISQPVCHKTMIARCDIDCSNNVINGLATVPKLEGSIFSVHQFWPYFIVMSLFWISQATIWNLQDPICFDLLDDKPYDYGKQRCWGSISWGLFSVFGGALVDYFSTSNLHKNYVPIYCVCIVITLCDFMVAYKIKITETTGSKHMTSNLLKLLTDPNVIVYFVWVVVLGMCSALPWNYLFWYMEDISYKYQSCDQSWIKTLQGLAVGINCIGGELPFLFFSGWFIKRLGNWYCMSLGLFVFAIRFFLYSIITNPVWILPVEFSNGLTFGLSHAVLLAHARNIAPLNAVTSVIGMAGALYEGVGTSLGGFLGGFLYENYGGAWTFHIFSYASLLMFTLHILYIKFKNI